MEKRTNSPVSYAGGPGSNPGGATNLIEVILAEGACPLCKGYVEWEPACPTHYDYDKDDWSVCYGIWEYRNFLLNATICNEAQRYNCVGHEPDPYVRWAGCGWSYLHGMNQDNPRSIDNEKQRPSWLDCTFYPTHILSKDIE